MTTHNTTQNCARDSRTRRRSATTKNRFLRFRICIKTEFDFVSTLFFERKKISISQNVWNKNGVKRVRLKSARFNLRLHRARSRGRTRVVRARVSPPSRSSSLASGVGFVRNRDGLDYVSARCCCCCCCSDSFASLFLVNERSATAHCSWSWAVGRERRASSKVDRSRVSYEVMSFFCSNFHGLLLLQVLLQVLVFWLYFVSDCRRNRRCSRRRGTK